jgi:prevent-host-death family protein
MTAHAREVGIYEAKTHLARLVDEVEQGETITITRHGRPVARLVPVSDQKRRARAAIEAIIRERKGRRLDGISIRELIEEGRRF